MRLKENNIGQDMMSTKSLSDLDIVDQNKTKMQVRHRCLSNYLMQKIKKCKGPNNHRNTQNLEHHSLNSKELKNQVYSQLDNHTLEDRSLSSKDLNRHWHNQNQDYQSLSSKELNKHIDIHPNNHILEEKFVVSKKINILFNNQHNDQNSFTTIEYYGVRCYFSSAVLLY